MDEVQKIYRRPTYTMEQKLDIVKQCYVLGNMRRVSEINNISYETIQNWKKNDWWWEAEENLKRQAHVEVDTKLKDILDRGLDVIADRLTNGEQVLNNKTGELVYKPVSLRDAAAATNTVLTHKRAMQKDLEERQERRENMKDTLSALAQEFARWNLRKNNKDAIDVQATSKDDDGDDDALHDERETRLQEGSGEVHE